MYFFIQISLYILNAIYFFFESLSMLIAPFIVLFKYKTETCSLTVFDLIYNLLLHNLFSVSFSYKLFNTN